MTRLLAFAVLLMLASCGTLPQPFLGRPGAEGARLAVPPPPVLMVPSPRNALLGDKAAKLYAKDMAQALVKQDVPSIARSPGTYDWRLETTAKISGSEIIPEFAIIGPNKKTYGNVIGTPVEAAAWANGDSEALQTSAAAAASTLAKQLAAINAAVQQSNPQSLENRPPRVLFIAVTGAPGDGDHALALDLKRDLPALGIVMVERKDDADFVVAGTVKVSPNAGAPTDQPSDIVELAWTVKSQSGRFIGKVSQLHDLKPSEMAPYWGDIAAAAAKQAALGIKQVITNATPKSASAVSASASVGPSAPAKPQPPPAP